MRPLTPRQAERRRRRAIKVAYKWQQYEDARLQEVKTEAFLRELAENERHWQTVSEELHESIRHIEARERNTTLFLTGCAIINLVNATIRYLGHPEKLFSGTACYFYLSLIAMLALGYRSAADEQPLSSKRENLFIATCATLLFVLLPYGLYRLFT